jgi:DNA-binding NarL/FixJ family response regulator
VIGIANGSDAGTGVADASSGAAAGTPAAGRSVAPGGLAAGGGDAIRSRSAAGGGSAAAGRDAVAGPAAVAADIIDVAAVDNHPIVLDGIASWVTAPDGGIRVVGTASTVDSLLAGPGRRACVVLLDLELGDGTAIERNVATILAAGPAVLVLAASDKPRSVRAAMRAGALGYVLKDEETVQVRAAIRSVAAGQGWISPRLAYIFATDDATDRPELSPQETRALQLYATGMAMKSVAKRMSLSEETVKQYVGRVREKYARAGRAAPTKLELYHRAVEDGHLPPHP